MDPLADLGDVTARGITIPAGVDAAALLEAASSTVREAAGCPISQVTSTVTLLASNWCNIDLPGYPVTAVASVTVNGDTVTGWTLFGNTLRMPSNWTSCLPVNVTVTYTHGLPTVPDDIVDLVCSVVGIAVSLGYGTTERLQSFRLGDYSEAFTPAAGSDSPSPVALPDSVRNRLRARFGSNVAVV